MIIGVRVAVLTTVAVRNGVRVDTAVLVGTKVLVGTLVGVLESPIRGSGSVGVPMPGVRLGTGVKVLLGVNVGVAEISGVAVGVEEAVRVGIVCVGNGPNKACIVPAMAVLMLSTLCGLFPRPKTPLLRKREPNPTNTNAIHRSI